MGLPQFQCTCDNFGVTPSYTNDTFDVTKEFAVSVGLKNPNLMAMAIVPSVIKNYHDLLYMVHVTSIKKDIFYLSPYTTRRISGNWSVYRFFNFFFFSHKKINNRTIDKSPWATVNFANCIFLPVMGIRKLRQFCCHMSSAG